MELLTVKLPTKVAYEIAERKRSTFALKTKTTERGTIAIFSAEDGTAEHPELSTVALAQLYDCRWNGRRWVHYITGIVPVVPHFPVLMEEKVVRREVPDALLEPYPKSENLRRWFKK